MNSFDEMITTFVRQMRYAPTYSSYADFVEMTKTFVEKLSTAPRFVYALYDMNPDSMNSVPRMMSIHASLDGAIEAVPDNLKGYERDILYGDYVKNYVYVAIRKIEVLVP
jgi:hypothetical protein